MYSFDAVHIPEVKLAMMKAWNHPQSKTTKLFITNSNPEEVDSLGYEDILLVNEIRVNFSKMNNGCESRPCYFYLRKSMTKKPKNKWAFGSVSPSVRTKTTSKENDRDPFQDVWKMFYEERRCNGCKINWKIVEHNMRHQDGQNFVERGEKTNRKVKVDYNEQRQEQSVWKTARLSNKRNG